MSEEATEQIALTVEGVAEGLLPVLVPFSPAIRFLVQGIVRAHYNATHAYPTPDQVKAALPAGWQALQATRDTWKPSGDGTLPAPGLFGG